MRPLLPLSPAVLLAAALAFASAACPAETIPAAGPLVRTEGRTVATPRKGVRLGYPGVALHLSAQGPSLAARAETSADEVDFDVLVDGRLARRVRLPRGESDTTLFEGASDAAHTVELVHCTETSNGVCEFETFSAKGFLSPPPAPPRRLLFIGDSFTCGAAAECRPGLPVRPTKSQRQNARLSYGWLLSRALGAEVSIVAYAGRGLLRDWQGLSSPREAPEFYEYAIADDPATPWPHATYVPDAIGVCLGNDFDAGVPDETSYVRAYVEFVRKLRRDAPGAAIVLIVSPVVSDRPGSVPRHTVLRAYLDQVAKALGDPRVLVAEVGTYPGVPGDWHPDGTAHESVASLLDPILRKALPSAQGKANP